MHLMEWAQASGTLRSQSWLENALLGAPGSPHPWPSQAQEFARRLLGSSQARVSVVLSRPFREGPGRWTSKKIQARILRVQWGHHHQSHDLRPWALCTVAALPLTGLLTSWPICRRAL